MGSRKESRKKDSEDDLKVDPLEKSKDYERPNDRPLQLKTEMSHLILSDEAKGKILETIKYLSGKVSNLTLIS